MDTRPVDLRSSPSPTRRVVALPSKSMLPSLGLLKEEVREEEAIEEAVTVQPRIRNPPVPLVRAGSLGRGDAMFAQRRAKLGLPTSPGGKSRTLRPRQI